MLGAARGVAGCRSGPRQHRNRFRRTGSWRALLLIDKLLEAVKETKRQLAEGEGPGKAVTKNRTVEARQEAVR